MKSYRKELVSAAGVYQHHRAGERLFERERHCGGVGTGQSHAHHRFGFYQ